MNRIQNLLKKRFSQEILGGVLGVIVAVVMYQFGAELPSMQVTKGQLVDPSPTTVNEEQTVRVNDKEVDDIKLQRLAARAALLQKQQEETDRQAEAARVAEPEQPQEVLSVSPEQAVTDRMDPLGQTMMRENRRELASAFDLFMQDVQAEEPSAQPVEVAQVPDPVPPDEEIAVAVDAIAAPLTDSGPMLNTILLLSFGVACFIKRHSLIAVCRSAY